MAKTKKQIMEELNDFAAFLTLTSKNAERLKKESKGERAWSFNAGREVAYGVAFKKLDLLIKESG